MYQKVNDLITKHLASIFSGKIKSSSFSNHPKYKRFEPDPEKAEALQ